ncbi:MAG: diacylglycerol kinase family protein [Sarcina sp.]|nr:diacylglycerol kinase family protein [Sarcina sp.]
MKYIYFVNRFSLRDETDAVINRIKSVSEEFHRDYIVEVSGSAEEAVLAIRKYHDAGAVLTAVGGDGSIHHLLNEIAGTNNLLSFVPCGTGNDFSRTCLETLEDGVHEVDLIRVNDRYCINTVCFGIDADIANDESFIHNRFIPRSMRFNAGVLYHFLTYGKKRYLTVEWGKKKISRHFTTVVAANGRYYGSGYKVSPGSLLNDGRMEIYLIDSVGKVKMARLILSMKNAGHLQDPALRVFRAKKVTVSSPVPIRANVDGEPLQADHFELNLIPRAVRLEYDQSFIERVRELSHI